MDISIKGVSLAQLFTPKNISEKQINPINALSLKILDLSLAAWKEEKYESFDAAALDFGCERQALKNYGLALGGRGIFETKNEKDTVYVNKKTAFLLQCYLLRYIRVTEQTKDGKEKFITNIQLFKNLKIPDLSKASFEKIVMLFRDRVSLASAQYISKKANAFSNVIGDKLKLEKMRLQKGKYICSSFYALKCTVLTCKNEKIPILIKKISKQNENTRWGVICQSQGVESEFEQIQIENKKTPLIVFAMYVDTTIKNNQFVDALKKQGVTDTIFYNGVIAEQVFPKDEELLEYKHTGLQTSLFVLDHVYASTLKLECENGVELCNN